MKTRVLVVLVTAAVLLIGAQAVVSVPAQEPTDKPQSKQAKDKPQQTKDKPADQKGFPDLVGALKASPGCLGVETARTASGKQVIFAWFEDKKAVLKWYHSQTHQQVMKQFFEGQEYGKPLADVPDDVGPIMAIASITFSDKPKFEETPLPISQIAIELYKPITGGIFLGGRFAPDSLKVPHIKDYTPKESDAKADK